MWVRDCGFLPILLAAMLTWATISVASDPVDDLFTMSLDELMNLDVEVTTAGKTAEQIGDIPASVVVITRDDIVTYGYTTLQEILQHVPGFYMVDDYYWRGGENFGVRGFFTTGSLDNIVILVNGVSQTEDINGSNSMSKITIPVEAIDRIEVVRGPMSVMYGSGAFLGAVNIITDDVDSKKSPYFFSSGIGSNRSGRVFFRGSRTTEDMDLVVNLSGRYNAGLDIPYRNMISDMEPITLGTGMAEDFTTKDQLGRNSIYAGVAGHVRDFSFDLDYNEMHRKVIDALPVTTVGQEATTNALNLTLGYNRELLKDSRLFARLSYFQYNYQLDYNFGFDYNLSYFFDQSNTVETEANLFVSPSERLNMTLGLYMRSNYLAQTYWSYPYPGIMVSTGNNTLDSKTPNLTKAIFGQVTFSPSAPILLIAGLRLEHANGYRLNNREIYEDEADETYDMLLNYSLNVSSSEIRVIPRLAAIWRLHPQHRIKLIYGESTKQPSIWANSEALLFNDTLDSPHMSTYEVNYLGNLSTNYLVNVSVFYNLADQLITRKNSMSACRTSNLGEMTTLGYELGVTAKPWKSVQIEADATYYNSKDKREGCENVEPGYAPKALGYLKTKYLLSPSLSLALTGRYIGRTETEWVSPNYVRVEPPSVEHPDGVFENVPYRRGQAIKAYSVWDINLHLLNFFRSRATVNARVTNILDQEVRYPTTGSNIWADKGYLGEGRSFLLNIGWSF